MVWIVVKRQIADSASLRIDKNLGYTTTEAPTEGAFVRYMIVLQQMPTVPYGMMVCEACDPAATEIIAVGCPDVGNGEFWTPSRPPVLTLIFSPVIVLSRLSAVNRKVPTAGSMVTLIGPAPVGVA